MTFVSLVPGTPTYFFPTCTSGLGMSLVAPDCTEVNQRAMEVPFSTDMVINETTKCKFGASCIKFVK